MEGSNPKLDLININAFTKSGEILCICSQDIKRNRNSDSYQGPYKFVKRIGCKKAKF